MSALLALFTKVDDLEFVVSFVVILVIVVWYVHPFHTPSHPSPVKQRYRLHTAWADFPSAQPELLYNIP